MKFAFVIDDAFMKRKEAELMNKQNSDVLTALLLEPFINQRILA